VATAQALGDVWRRLRRSTIFPLNPATGLLGFLGQRDSLLLDRGLKRALRPHMEFERLEDAPIPLYVTATDVLTGEAVRLASGDTVRAVAASAAISGVLPAVAWDGRELVDGGVADNTPLSHASSSGPPRSTCCPPEPRAR